LSGSEKRRGGDTPKFRQAVKWLWQRVFRQTVKNVLLAAGLGPDPHSDPDTWNKFLKRHADTLWQCDFASKRKWTVKGLVDLYLPGLHPHRHSAELGFAVHREPDGGLDQPAGQEVCDARGRARSAVQDGDS
jgi:hypothetical protein